MTKRIIAAVAATLLSFTVIAVTVAPTASARSEVWDRHVK